MRKKNAILNVSSSFALQIVMIISGFIVPRIIISNFGSNVNGLVSSITQFLGYITLLDSGFTAVVKASLYKPISENNKETIIKILKASESFFRKIALVFIIYIIVLSIIYPIVISEQFEFLFTFSLIIIISISSFSEYYFGMTYKIYLQSNQQNYLISFVQIATYLINIIIIIILIYFNCSIHVIKLFGAFVFLLRPLFLSFYVKRKYNINLKNTKNNYKIKNKWDGLAQHIASVIHDNTDITILTFFSNLYEISVYSVYRMIVNSIKMLVNALTSGIDASFGDMLAKKEYSNLNKKFDIYETLYLIISAVLFNCTLVLITPFISIYTIDITDINYCRPVFGYLMVISEYIWAIRAPYSTLVLAAGHLKQTKRGAVIEACLNIGISILLVGKMGMSGILIGTIVAMMVRTIEFVYYANKNILKRNIITSVKKILTLLIVSPLVLISYNYFCKFEPNNYLEWIITAIIVFIIITIIIYFICIFVFKKNIIEVLFMNRKNEVKE